MIKGQIKQEGEKKTITSLSSQAGAVFHNSELVLPIIWNAYTVAVMTPEKKGPLFTTVIEIRKGPSFQNT